MSLSYCSIQDVYVADQMQSASVLQTAGQWSGAINEASFSFEEFREQHSKRAFTSELEMTLRDSENMGVAVEHSTVVRAYVIGMAAIRAAIGPPETSVTESGDIVLDWRRRGSIFSVIAEAEGRLHYAWIADAAAQRQHGELPYEGNQTSQVLVRLLREWQAKIPNWT